MTRENVILSIIKHSKTPVTLDYLSRGTKYKVYQIADTLRKLESKKLIEAVEGKQTGYKLKQ